LGGSNNGGGGSHGKGLNIPRVTPPVKKATPASFVSRRRLKGRNLQMDQDVENIKDRFFSDGPTYVFNILGSVDDQLSFISTQGSLACESQVPVEETRNIFGEMTTWYWQCGNEAVATSPDGAEEVLSTQFGVHDDKYYFYMKAGEGITAAIVQIASGSTNIANFSNYNSSTTEYVVDTWFSVGISPDWHTGHSYAVTRIHADPINNYMEFTAAGSGIGYCGAQWISNSVGLFFNGSGDMGSSCNTPVVSCVDPNDFTQAGDCTGLSFALTPLGRIGGTYSIPGYTCTLGDSLYPGGMGNQVIINGWNDTYPNTSQYYGLDSTFFGPYNGLTAGIGLY